MKAKRDPNSDGTVWNYRDYTIVDQRNVPKLRLHAPWLAQHKNEIFVEACMTKEGAMQVIDTWILKDIITPEKKEKLTHLWFRFGNYGIKHTAGNHKFIQRFLDGPSDERNAYKHHGLTQECIKAVDEILRS